MAELDKLLASCFAAADRTLGLMQASGLAAASLLTQHSAIIRVALVASALALSLCVPLLVLYKLFGSEHGSIPRLDVTLTAEETAENADKKWVCFLQFFCLVIQILFVLKTFYCMGTHCGCFTFPRADIASSHLTVRTCLYVGAWDAFPEGLRALLRSWQPAPPWQRPYARHDSRPGTHTMLVIIIYEGEFRRHFSAVELRSI